MPDTPISHRATLVADAETVIYTVPANKVAVVQYNVAANSSTAEAGSVIIAISGTDAAADGQEVEPHLAFTGPALLVHRDRQVLAAGDRLIAKATTATVDITVSGFVEDE